MDLTGDGVKELIVFTMKGLYIFQVYFTIIQYLITSAY